MRALDAPIKQIAINAGVDGSIVAQKVRESKQKNFGYDAAKAEYVDMVKAGIIDPTKVVKAALANAASVATLLLTTEVMIAEIPEKKDASAMPPGGGGMGGMY